MEKMSWPSERIAHGGIFHQRNVNYSRETNDMIKSKEETENASGVHLFLMSLILFFYFSSTAYYLPSSISTNERGQFDNDATQ